MKLIIAPNGTIRCLYDETLDLQSLGAVSIQRGSHVEPTAAGAWIADLSPVNGLQLGPFPNRSAALNAEQDWLEAHWLMPSVASISADDQR